jgi:hypothetical protein
MEKEPSHSHNFVISTGAQRSGEICGEFSRVKIKFPLKLDQTPTIP